MLYNFARWWHLFSLDAPTVAALWSWLFARAMHLRVPLLAILLLAAATWLLYVTDRILDGLRRGGTDLRERHLFYARHRRPFVVSASILAVLLGWMVFTRMSAQTLQDDLFLSPFAALYLLSIHVKSRSSRASRSSWLPKELAVGLLFAAATAVPAWSRMSRYPELAKVHLAQAVLLFAILCWINCVAIEKWEAGCPVSPGNAKLPAAHPSTQWVGAHLQSIVCAIALLSVAAAWLARTSGLGEVYLAAFLSCGLFLALDAERPFLSPLCLRIAADAALLTPLAIFPILRYPLVR